MRKNYRARRRRRLASFQDNLCFFCDEPLLFFPEDLKDHNDPRAASDDHFVARAVGGRGTLNNLVIAHRDCNSKLNHEEKDDLLLEKLRLLNEKRGLDENETEPFGSLESYIDVSPAAVALFDRLNTIPLSDIRYARRIIIRIFSNYHHALKQFRAMPDEEFRYKLFKKWLSEYLYERAGPIDIVQHALNDDEFSIFQYLQNILLTYGKQKLLRGGKNGSAPTN